MRLACCSLLLFLSVPALAQDAQRGRLLYETYCGQCHYERVHQRERSRSLVHSMADLRGQVERWAPHTGVPFTAEDIEAVVEYLNRSHYQLP
jgi:mono/diheme cytochrome c family protein